MPWERSMHVSQIHLRRRQSSGRAVRPPSEWNVGGCKTEVKP